MGLLLYLTLFVTLALLITNLTEKFKRDKKLKRPFYDFGDHQMLVVTLLLSALLVFLVNRYSSTPSFDDPEEMIAYGKERDRPQWAEKGYNLLLLKDSLNPDYHFERIKVHFRGYDPDVEVRDSLTDLYQVLSWSNDNEISETGLLGLALCRYQMSQSGEALEVLMRIQNTHLKYYNYLKGNLFFHVNDSLSEHYYNLEIENNGYLEGSYKNLALLYHRKDSMEALGRLMDNTEANEHISLDIKTDYLFRNGLLFSYMNEVMFYLAKSANLIGFLGAFLVMMIWILYLKKIDIYREEKWADVIGIIILSALLAFPTTSALSDFNRIVLNLELNGSIINDLAYCVLGIGAVEEAVKIAPFLIFLKFTRAIDEPIDYIVYASLSALGFAFAENLLYFSSDRLDIIHTRALTASVAHMIFSSTIAYGLFLAHFKNKANQLGYFLLFFTLASVCHGLYDFFLINENLRFFWIITFLLLLSGILVFASFINNALNHSHIPKSKITLNTTKLSVYLTSSLIMVILFEYIFLSVIYGPETGNMGLFSALAGGGYLILFLSIRLSNIDIVPGEWAPIQFYIGFLPFSILRNGRKLNYNQVLGSRIKLSAVSAESTLWNSLPCEGEIIERVKISGEHGWFIVRLNEPFLIDDTLKQEFLIRARDKNVLIENHSDIIVYFYNIPDPDALRKRRKLRRDFEFIDWAILN